MEPNRPESEELAQQAASIVALLPAVMRHLFCMDDELHTELPLAQLRVCSILTEGPRSMSVLSRETGVSLSAMTQIADRLERARLVKRVSEGTDRRVRRLQLTPHGEHLMHRRDEERLHMARTVLAHLTPAAREELLGNLKVFHEACFAVAESCRREEPCVTEKIGA